MEPEQQNWQQTLDSITEQARLMDAIHEAHPGKENRELRDRLCTPHCAICVRLHYRRIDLLRLANYIITDTKTGTEYIGVSGIGITETGSHQAGKARVADER